MNYNKSMRTNNFKPRVVDYVYLCLFALTSILILFFASLSGTVSSSQSSALLNMTESILKAFNIALTDVQLENLHVVIRKAIGHFGLFMVDGIFAWLTARHWIRARLNVRFSLTMGVGIFIAALSEFLQLFAVNRGPSFGDAVLDSLGFFVGILIVYLISIPLDNKRLSEENKKTPSSKKKATR